LVLVTSVASAQQEVDGRAGRVRAGRVTLMASWIGQEPRDLVGPGPGVGPDGFQDAAITLARLNPTARIAAVTIVGRDGKRWESGINPKGFANAELVRNEKDSSRGVLSFQPDRDLAGQPLAIVVRYEDGKLDRATVAAGRFDPTLRMPRMTLPKVSAAQFTANWLGQDGTGAGPGDVHVELSGLPAERAIVSAVLTDSVRGTWVYRRDEQTPSPTSEQVIRPLVFRRGDDRTRASMTFSPIRDESRTAMTLRLIFQGGDSVAASIPGGACDPDRRAPERAKSSVVARPGEDLNALADRYGTVTLSPGTYEMSRPLILPKPVALVGDGHATLVFAQGPGEAPWTAAIKIHRGGTKLHGFAVRFKGPVRWNREVSWGPALIGLTDNLDGLPPDPKIGLSFTNLDIEAPRSANPSVWEEAPRLLRLVGAEGGGTIKGNTFRGGSIQFFDGPWIVSDNDYRGTQPGTVSSGFIGSFMPRDVVISNNRVRSLEPSGKTWRFLVMVGQGSHDRVVGNTVIGIGPRDDDTIPPANMPEVVLTESYHLRFEGAPAAVSADRRVIGVSAAHSDVHTGDIVSVLAGPHAGQWRKVAQVITPQVYLLESPLPDRPEVIAISPGFVDELFAKNLIDSRGSKSAANFVFAGNHFGTRVLENRLLGGGDAFLAMAFPTETPGIWGWSHVPFLGCLFEGNAIEDSERGGTLGVQRNGYTKSTRGRLTFVATFRGNTVHWSKEFLARRQRSGAKGPPRAITVGYPGSLDPKEQAVDLVSNRLEAPPGFVDRGSVWVESGEFNGLDFVGRSFKLAGSERKGETR
jgi:hypothetical protein